MIQRLKQRLLECEHALEQIEHVEHGYKFIGNLLIQKPKDLLKKELTEEIQELKDKIAVMGEKNGQ